MINQHQSHIVCKELVILMFCLLLAAAALSAYATVNQSGTNASPDLTFLNPPKIIADVEQNHSRASRKFEGIPSMAISANGRLWAVWYASKTPAEDENNYVVVSTSGDGGRKWREVLVVDADGDGPVRDFDPQVWVDPDGRLWVFWAQAIDHDGTVAGVWAITTGTPDKYNPKWSAPRRLTDGVMMNKPLVLSSGEWVLQASTWRKTNNSARMVISTDHGRTWQLRGACNVPNDVRDFDEHMIIERNDKTLWMLARTTYGIGESFSSDRGRTWSQLSPSTISHPNARFFIRRLSNGELLLVKHNSQDRSRSNLTAYVSDDDGKTWQGGLLLDERQNISYPDGMQDKNGLIWIIYDHNRINGEILLAKFRVEDARAGKNVSGAVSLKQVICANRHD